MDFSTRIMFQPRALKTGDYLVVVLEWVGNLAFQHSALSLTDAGEAPLGLGSLRPFFNG